MCPGSDDTLRTKFYSNGSVEKSFYKQFTFSKSDSLTNKVIVVILPCLLLYSYYSWDEQLYPSLLTVSTACLYIAACFFTVVEEELLLLVPIRLQMTSVYSYGQKHTVSIPWHLIADFMIIDEITCQQVVPFLAVQLNVHNHGQSHVLLFTHTRPRLPKLERIYRDLQNTIDDYR